jgi:hypothetical protein
VTIPFPLRGDPLLAGEACIGTVRSPHLQREPAESTPPVRVALPQQVSFGNNMDELGNLLSHFG